MEKPAGTSKKNIYILIAYFFLWIILFEYILPVNRFLPKPSIVILSLKDLWNFYRLPQNFLYSVAAIYLSLIVSYLLLYFLRNILLVKNHLFADLILSLHWFFKYVPAIILGLFFIYWLPQSFYTEFIFIFLTSFLMMVIKLKERVPKVNKEFIEAAISLGASEKIIREKIIWKAVQPDLLKFFPNLHFFLWSVLLAFEYIKGGFGLGNIFRMALQYKDLSILFSTTAIVGFVIYLGSFSILYIKNKFIHWSTT